MKSFFTVYLAVLVYVLQISLSNSYSRSVSTISEFKEETGAKQGVTEQAVEDLFNKHIEDILKEGSSNRFFNTLVNPDGKVSLKTKLLKINAQESTQSEFKNPWHVRSTETSRLLDTMSQIALQISREMSSKNNLTMKNLKQLSIPSSFCPFKQQINCNPNNRFSEIDGACNNLQSPWKGRSETPYKRYLNPAYLDRLGIPRTRAKNGQELPNVRSISRMLCNENTLVDNHFTHMTAFFGQFLTHDISMAGVSTDSNGGGLDCNCNNGNPGCMPVVMPANENIMRMSCMKFTRSSSAFANFDCSLGHREQLNLMTHFIDLTTTYGPKSSRTNELRLFQGGQLKFSAGVNGRPGLLQQQGTCGGPRGDQCQFMAGETRLNENLPLVSIQVLFMREHNRIANELQRQNPHWDDEHLFQEARKITIAVYQHIIFNEYVPIIVGWNTASQFDLLPLPSGQFHQGYDANVCEKMHSLFLYSFSSS